MENNLKSRLVFEELTLQFIKSFSKFTTDTSAIRTENNIKLYDFNHKINSPLAIDVCFRLNIALNEIRKTNIIYPFLLKLRLIFSCFCGSLPTYYTMKSQATEALQNAKVDIDTSFSIIGWWINMIGFVSGASIYRELKREELSKEFDGDFEAYQRDAKINKITGNWWN